MSDGTVHKYGMAGLEAVIKAKDARIKELEEVSGWRDIETAPWDEFHVRGLWVKHKDGRMEWRQYIGYIDDETGEFIDENGEDFGWSAEDYEMWRPMSPPPQLQAQKEEQDG